MARISKRVLTFRERQRRGAIMRPSTFAEIERAAARGGARDPEAVAGAAYWKTLAAKYRDGTNPYEKTGGLHIEYSPVNQAYFLMWHGTVLQIFESKKDAKAELAYLLRTSKPQGNPRHKTVPELLRDCDNLRKALPSRMRVFDSPMGNPRARVFFDESIEKYVASVYHPRFGNLFMTGETEKQARAALKRRIKQAERAGTARNPDDELPETERLYETFHGREPREILELTESAVSRGEYVALGDLVELTIVTPDDQHVKVGFKNDGVRLASTAEGTQLVLLGGNQDVSGTLGMFGSADTSKDLLDLGEAKQIVYEAAKWQTDFTPQEWKHDFGEESGIRPRVFFDQLNKRLCFAGGTYRVERPGIVD